MEINWLGRNCFRLKGRDGAVLTDPCPPDSGYTYPRQPADIVTISRADDPGYSYAAGASADALVLDAPGEYEHGGVLVTGLASRRPDGIRNVVFIIEIDGIRIGHLGVPGPNGPSILEEIKNVDILLLPVGGGNSLGGAAAADAMTTIDPRIVLPMNYRTDVETMELDPLERFLKETGSKAEPQPKLTVTKNSLPSELSIMLLQPRS